MPQITEEQAEALEKLIDTHGLGTVVEAIALICGEKGEHLRTNWQDAAAAKEWDKNSQRLFKVAAQLE